MHRSLQGDFILVLNCLDGAKVHDIWPCRHAVTDPFWFLGPWTAGWLYFIRLEGFVVVLSKG
jgi:hypothetical protein